MQIDNDPNKDEFVKKVANYLDKMNKIMKQVGVLLVRYTEYLL